MSKKSLLLSCLGWILFGTSALFANPLVNLPSGNMACTVAITAHLNSPAPDPSMPDVQDVSAPSKDTGTNAMKAADIIRVGKLQRNIITWSSGTTSEAWTLIDTGLTLAEKATGPTKFIYELPKASPTRNSISPTILDLDADSVTWIFPRSLIGKTAYKGKPSLHYQRGISLPAAIGPPRTVLYQAWIDPKTLVPIAFDDGDALYELTFSKDPPTQPLVLPDRFQKELQEYENANAVIRHL